MEYNRLSLTRGNYSGRTEASCVDAGCAQYLASTRGPRSAALANLNAVAGEELDPHVCREGRTEHSQCGAPSLEDTVAGYIHLHIEVERYIGGLSSARRPSGDGSNALPESQHL